ncbi:MAG: hypothetical protein LBR84_04125, partial [Tannerella sp.]|nr:hypothetical protein [Tannerella sp.]
VVPDSGYVFAGWSHPAYVSLKGVEVPADSGVFDLDTLPIYGDVELTARFASESLASSKILAPDMRDQRENPSPRIWSSGNELFVQPIEMPSVLRLYTLKGILIRQQTLLNKNVTKIKMSQGVYIVTLNNGIGVKIMIE